MRHGEGAKTYVLEAEAEADLTYDLFNDSGEIQWELQQLGRICLIPMPESGVPSNLLR